MKRYILLLTTCLSWQLCIAQIFDVDTLQYNGIVDKYINIVIMSDGYMENELPQFVTDAQSFTNALFDERPFKEYANMFNVFIIKVPSNESGADHPGTATDVDEPAHPVVDVDNYFGSTFDFAAIHRLLVATNNTNITNVLANNFPAYDQALILVNSPHYGGSGGQIPVASTDAAANEVAIHEIGHSFSRLSDEYWAGDQFAGESTNMTQETNPEMVKWKNWHNEQGVGIYQHCCGGVSASWYKPHQNCKMQTLGEPFCSVCIEGIIEEIHQRTNTVAGYLPEEAGIQSPVFPLTFQVEVEDPIPNTIKIDWVLNGKSLNHDQNTLEIVENELIGGLNELKLIIHDTTSLLRVDQHETVHFSQKIWTITNGQVVTGLDDNIMLDNEFKFDIYPNPLVENQFNIKLNASAEKNIEIRLYTLQGKLLTTLVPSVLQKQQEVMVIKLEQFDGKVFLLKVLQEGTELSTKKILKQ